MLSPRSPRCSSRRTRFPARLFWRVYLNGLVLFVVVALAVFAVTAALGRAPPGRMSRGASFVAAGLLALAVASIPLARRVRTARAARARRLR